MASNLVITQLIFPINTNWYTVNGLNLVVTWWCSLIVRVSVVLRRTVVGCSDCHASYIGETGRNLATRLTDKRATRKGDVNNHIAEHHWLTNHTIDWDSVQYLTYSTNYFQWLTLESWFTNLKQTPLNRCQPLLAPYKRLIHDINITNEPNRTT